MEEAQAITQIWLNGNKAGLWFALILENDSKGLSCLKLGQEDKGISIESTDEDLQTINNNLKKLISVDDCLREIFSDKRRDTDCFYFINYLLVSARLKKFVKSRIKAINPSHDSLERVVQMIERDFSFHLLADFLRDYMQKRKK